MPLDLPSGHLNAGHIDQYWHQGFLHPLPGLTAAEAAVARAELEAIEAQ